MKFLIELFADLLHKEVSVDLNNTRPLPIRCWIARGRQASMFDLDADMASQIIYQLKDMAHEPGGLQIVVENSFGPFTEIVRVPEWAKHILYVRLLEAYWELTANVDDDRGARSSDRKGTPGEVGSEAS